MNVPIQVIIKLGKLPGSRKPWYKNFEQFLSYKPYNQNIHKYRL